MSYRPHIFNIYEEYVVVAIKNSIPNNASNVLYAVGVKYIKSLREMFIKNIISS